MAVVTVLDAEAVHVLATKGSNKRWRLTSHFDFARRAATNVAVVPSTVRVEAGWDRTAPRWAAINRLGIVDHHLDRESTDVAARLRAEHGVSPADAHIGAIAHGRGDDRVVVITSDAGDIAAVTAGTGARIIRL
jgi:predicted nucleic acid-binding protein